MKLPTRQGYGGSGATSAMKEVEMMTNTVQTGGLSASTAAAVPVVAPGNSSTAAPPRRKDAGPRRRVAGNDTRVRPRARHLASILVVDDDAMDRKVLRRYLESAGYKVIEASGGGQGIAKMSEEIAVALLDLDMPDLSAVQCLRHVREHFPDTQVIMVSATGEIRDAVTAMKEGACEYFTKPCDQDELLARVGQAVRAFKLARDNRSLRQAVSCPMASGELLGGSPPMQAVRKQIEAFSQLDSTVLITGAGGTGKTVAAQLIHRKGPRAEEAFVAVNCGALPRDLIEAELFGHLRGAFAGATGDRPGRAVIADGGTLFLDDVGDLPLELQPKLLTFLQERTVQRVGADTASRVDVRVIAASSRDLGQMCREGSFREDLLFRLDVLSLYLPALEQRSMDIPELASAMLRRIACRRGSQPPVLAEDAVEALTRYDWPGNVREMENVLERASAFCDDAVLRQKDLALAKVRPVEAPAENVGAGASSLAGMTLAEIERRALIQTLHACKGNRVKTARQLGVSEKTVYNKIKQFNLTGIV